MKKKILSLLLVLMLIPFASLFAACGDKGYNLANLQKDFVSIADQNENIVANNNELLFDYSSHPKLEGVFTSNYPYTTVLEYNQVYYNLMSFAFNYIDVCSNNNAIESEDVRNRVKRELDVLQNSIHQVDIYVNMLAEIINVSENDDVLSIACLARLENLLVAYESLFDAATTFNNTLADLYFNHILFDGNPNVYALGSANFDVNPIIHKFDARLKYQLSNLSQCFVEMYINGAKLSKKIIDGDVVFSLNAFNYSSNVTAIKKTYNELVAYEKATNNKQAYYELCVEAYNIQTALNNDNDKFIVACKTIAYAGFDEEVSTGNEKLCVEIIEERFELVKIYNAVLVEMLALTT